MAKELEIELIANEKATLTLDTENLLELELEFGVSTMTSGTDIVTIEVVEVTVPDIFSNADVVKNVGGASGILVLDAAAPVPVGTPAGTIILRRS